MGWDSAPPSKQELAASSVNWYDEPPKKEELSADQSYDWSNAPRDLIRSNIDALPMYGQAAGSLLGPIGSGLGQSAGNSLKEGINALIDRPLSDNFRLPTSDDVLVVAGDAGKNFAQGAASEMGGQIIGKALPMAVNGIRSGADKIGNALGKEAEKFAVNSTGATGAQVSKFADDAGRELLDRKLVRFGDNAENIASRTHGAMDDANSVLDRTLKELDSRGVTASADNVVKDLETRISKLRQDPSQADIVKKLENIVLNITGTGESNIPISLAEQTKRGFNRAAGNWVDLDAGQAGKTAYQAYRGEVENAAQNAAPELASQFKDAKETFGLLAPIQEASQRRASTLNQSPFGGLLDTATVGATGATIGGPVGLATGVAGAVARKTIAPRVTSSAAVGLDAISKALMKSPQVAELSIKNPQAFEALLYKIQEKLGPESMAPMSRAAESPDESTQSLPPKNVPPNKDDLIKKAEGSKYSQVLQNAANNGDDSFSAAHFVLSQRDPEYRKTIGFEN